MLATEFGSRYSIPYFLIAPGVAVSGRKVGTGTVSMYRYLSLMSSCRFLWNGRYLPAVHCLFCTVPVLWKYGITDTVPTRTGYNGYNDTTEVVVELTHIFL